MKLEKSRTPIDRAKSIALDLLVILASVLVSGGITSRTGYAAIVLVLPLSFAGWYAYKDYKFRNAFVMKLVFLAILRSVFILAIPFIIILNGIYFVSVSVLVVGLSFTFFAWQISSFLRGKLYKANEGKCRFDSHALSVAYDKKTKMLRIATKTANYHGPLPSDFAFFFEKEISTISTDTRATTSSGESITFHRTGSFQAHTRTFVYVTDTRGNASFINDGYPRGKFSYDKYIFVIEAADALKQILNQISRIYADKMAPIYEAERKQAQEIEIAATQQRKADEEAAKEAANQKILENVRNQRSDLLEKAGINEADCFKCYRYWEKDGGYICAMLAADKEGRGCAIFNEGKDTWLGSWKNAQINEVGDTLEVQIEDPEYRKLNLKERRFIIKYFSREDRLEWIDRIRILSAQA